MMIIMQMMTMKVNEGVDGSNYDDYNADDDGEGDDDEGE